jgi:hypothetical protein
VERLIRPFWTVSRHTTIHAVHGLVSHLCALKELRRKLCDSIGPEALKSWEDLMLGSFTHNEIIVEAKGGLVNQKDQAACSMAQNLLRPERDAGAIGVVNLSLSPHLAKEFRSGLSGV